MSTYPVDHVTELLARMWIECDPNRDPAQADEIQPEMISSGSVGPDSDGSATLTPNPMARQPRWHWFIPRAEATIAYLAKNGLEIVVKPPPEAA